MFYSAQTLGWGYFVVCVVRAALAFNGLAKYVAWASPYAQAYADCDFFNDGSFAALAAASYGVVNGVAIIFGLCRGAELYQMKDNEWEMGRKGRKGVVIRRMFQVVPTMCVGSLLLYDTVWRHNKHARMCGMCRAEWLGWLADPDPHQHTFHHEMDATAWFVWFID